MSDHARNRRIFQLLGGTFSNNTLRLRHACFKSKAAGALLNEIKTDRAAQIISLNSIVPLARIRYSLIAQTTKNYLSKDPITVLVGNELLRGGTEGSGVLTKIFDIKRA